MPEPPAIRHWTPRSSLPTNLPELLPGKSPEQTIRKLAKRPWMPIAAQDKPQKISSRLIGRHAEPHSKTDHNTIIRCHNKKSRACEIFYKVKLAYLISSHPITGCSSHQLWSSSNRTMPQILMLSPTLGSGSLISGINSVTRYKPAGIYCGLRIT